MAENCANSPKIPAKPNELFYLWHLGSINLLDAKNKPIGQIWDDKAQVKVAIIDNGLCGAHRNLDSNHIRSEIDFASREYGAKYTRQPTAKCDGSDGNHDNEQSASDAPATNANYPFANLKDKMLELVREPDPEQAIRDLLDKIPNSHKRELRRLIFRGDRPEFEAHNYDHIVNPSHLYSGHGTACAGIIAGRPADPISEQSETLSADGDAGEQNSDDRVIPYYGVEPQAGIIPINTPYSHEIRPVIMAMLYAVAHGADVILMPRSVNDPEASSDGKSCGEDEHSTSSEFNGQPRRDPRATRFDDNQALIDEKKTFELLLGWISKRLPVVVAAGNDGSSRLQYPARLVSKMGTENLIVVGAHNSWGKKSVYSSGHDQVTLFAPSDDGEAIYTDDNGGDVIRYDERGWRGRQLMTEAQRRGSLEHSAFGVLSLDIPGKFGSSAGQSGDESQDDQQAQRGLEGERRRYRRASQYTIFGGTSAASSIVAGVAALIQKAGRCGSRGTRFSGADVKDILNCNLMAVRSKWDKVPPDAIKTVDTDSAYRDARLRP